jgi:hypothetical protein
MLESLTYEDLPGIPYPVRNPPTARGHLTTRESLFYHGRDREIETPKWCPLSGSTAPEQVGLKGNEQ